MFTNGTTEYWTDWMIKLIRMIISATVKAFTLPFNPHASLGQHPNVVASLRSYPYTSLAQHRDSVASLPHAEVAIVTKRPGERRSTRATSVPG